jgi:hypothetical protein
MAVPQVRGTIIPGHAPLPPIGSGQTPSRAWYYRAHAKQVAAGGPPLLVRIGGMSFVKLDVLGAYCEQEARPVVSSDAPPRGARRKPAAAPAPQPGSGRPDRGRRGRSAPAA